MTDFVSVEQDAASSDKQQVRSKTLRGRGTHRVLKTRLCQATLLIAFLLIWQFLPHISAVRNASHIFDPYFISSPVDIAKELWDLMTDKGGVDLWSYLWPTVYASLVGTAIGMVLGAACGLVLSNFAFWSDVLRPFLVALNAIPRIALIPIVVLFFGSTLTSSVVLSVLVVFFVAFFNAYQGGTLVAPVLLENARLLGATKWGLLTRIRLPYVLAWTLAALPLSITFSLITVVTAELLTGYPGMGQLLSTAAATAQADLTFAVAGVLGVVGLVIVLISEQISRRVLHWWGK